PFEYILPLVSVLVGLALAALVVSLHGLLRRRRDVKWDWLPLAAALLAVLAVLETWWNFYAARDDVFYTTLGGFIPLAVQLILLFLLTAAALPDRVDASGTDLRTFYSGNASYFWMLFAVYVGFILLVRIIALVELGGRGFGSVIVSLIPNVVLLGLFVALARVQRRWFHAVVVIVLLVIFIIEWSGLSLESG